MSETSARPQPNPFIESRNVLLPVDVRCLSGFCAGCRVPGGVQDEKPRLMSNAIDCSGGTGTVISADRPIPMAPPHRQR